MESEVKFGQGLFEGQRIREKMKIKRNVSLKGATKGGLKRLLMGTAIVGAALWYGSCRYDAGAAQQEVAINARPYAIIEVQSEEMSYLRNSATREMLPLTEESWQVLDTYANHPAAMRRAMQATNMVLGGK